MTQLSILSFQLLTRCDIDDKNAPSLRDIFKSIDWSVGTEAGLQLVSYRDGERSDHLTLDTENGNHLVTMFRPEVPDTLDEVVGLDNQNWENERMSGLFFKDHATLGKVPMVEIGGNYWDARMVTTDTDLVKSLFREFYETGKLSHPWMMAD